MDRQLSHAQMQLESCLTCACAIHLIHLQGIDRGDIVGMIRRTHNSGVARRPMRPRYIDLLPATDTRRVVCDKVHSSCSTYIVLHRGFT